MKTNLYVESLIKNVGSPVGLCAVVMLSGACVWEGASDGGDVVPTNAVAESAAAITNTSNNQKLSIMHRCYMPTFGDGDHKSTTSRNCPTGTDEGQVFYVPSASETGTHALYELYKASGADHMDSTGAGEGGYTTEFTLGYPFNSSSAGTCEIRRWYKYSINDHVTAFCGENPGVYGYSQESVMGYGYNRYGNGGGGEKLVSVSGSAVTVEANIVAGGAIAKLTWNGTQFVNDWDYGRQIQTAVSLASSSGSSESDNPTEAGDKFGWPGGSADAGWAHGSPLLAYSVNGKTLTTTTAPLQWNPTNFGGDQDHPVRWRGTISKTLTLDFGSSNAIKYVTQIYFPMAQSDVRTEAVTAYLTGEFTKFYLYNAATDKLSDITPYCLADTFVKMSGPPTTNGAPVQPIQNGGIILANAAGTRALGGYHRDPGYTAYYQCANFFTQHPGTGRFDYGTAKWSIFGEYPSSSVAAGTTKTYVNYLTVGTLDTARSEMRRLYNAGY